MEKFFASAFGQIVKVAAFMGLGAFFGSLSVDIVPLISDPVIGAAVGSIIARFADKFTDPKGPSEPAPPVL